MNAMNTGVYEIANVGNGKRYVGSAVSFSQRWNEHRSLLRRGRHHSKHLQSAWAKYGEGAFTFRPLLICAPADLLVYEQIALDALAAEYNGARRAGSTFGMRHSEETKAKIAAKAIGRKRDRESVERGAAKLRGIKRPPSASAHLIGNKHAAGVVYSAERRAQISAQLTGMKRPKDAAYREKIAATLRGRKATLKHRANQAAAQLGKKRGPYKKRSPDA